MVPTLVSPDHSCNIRMHSDQHLGFVSCTFSIHTINPDILFNTFFVVELFSITTLDRLCCCFTLQECIELDCTITIFQNTQTYISVFIVSTTPTMLTIIIYQQCGIYSCVLYIGWITLIRCNKEPILKARDRHILKPINEVFCCFEDNTRFHTNTLVLM